MTSWTTKYLYIGTFMVCMFVVLPYWLHNSLSACVYYRTIHHQYRADCSGSNVLPGRDCPLCWHSLRHVCLWVLRAIWGWKGKTQSDYKFGQWFICHGVTALKINDCDYALRHTTIPLLFPPSSPRPWQFWQAHVNCPSPWHTPLPDTRVQISVAFQQARFSGYQ